MLPSLLKHAKIDKYDTQVMMRVRMQGVDPQCLPVAIGRLGRLPLLVERIAEIYVRIGQEGFAGDCLAEAVNGVGQVPLLQESDSQVIMRISVARIALERLPVAQDGCRRLPLLFEDDAQVVIRVRVAGVVSERLSKRLRRVGHEPLVLEDIAQMIVRPGIGGIQGNGPAQQRHGGIMTSQSMRHKTKQMMAAGMRGVGLSDLPAQSFRLLDIAALVVPHGQLKQLGDRRHEPAQRREMSLRSHVIR